MSRSRSAPVLERRNYTRRKRKQAVIAASRTGGGREIELVLEPIQQARVHKNLVVQGEKLLLPSRLANVAELCEQPDCFGVGRKTSFFEKVVKRCHIFASRWNARTATFRIAQEPCADRSSPLLQQYK